MTECFFDTETSGKANFKNSYKQAQPWIVQLGIVLSTKDRIYARHSFLIKPDGRTIEKQAEDVHGISVEEAQEFGISEATACYIFLEMLLNADTIVCHNVSFDRLLVAHMLYNNGFEDEGHHLMEHDSFCTMLKGVDVCKIPYRGGWKWPKLIELYKHLFGYDFVGAHDALSDTEATRDCYYKMNR